MGKSCRSLIFRLAEAAFSHLLHRLLDCNRLSMHIKRTTHASLTLLLGTLITDRQGRVQGRLKDVAVATGLAAGNVAGLLLKTREGSRLVAVKDVLQTPAGNLELREDAMLQPLRGDENLLLLQRDVVDQQIIDVHGRKVVRVNDVELQWYPQNGREGLRVSEVAVGLRGAVRRLFKGVVPRQVLENFAMHFPAKRNSVGVRGSD